MLLRKMKIHGNVHDGDFNHDIKLSWESGVHTFIPSTMYGVVSIRSPSL